MILRAVPKTFTPKSAGTYGDFGLQQLITGTFGVFFRMQEGSDSLTLIRLQNVLAHRWIENTSDQQSSGQRKDGCVLPLEAPKECADYQQRHQHHSGAQIRLFKNEGEWHAYQEPRFKQITQGKLIGTHFREEARQPDYYNQLYEF